MHVFLHKYANIFDAVTKKKKKTKKEAYRTKLVL